MLSENEIDPLNLKSYSFYLTLFLFWKLNFARKANLKISIQTDQHAPQVE